MRSAVTGLAGGARVAHLLAILLVAGAMLPARAQDATRRFDVAIKDGVVAREQRVLKVKQHERVRIVWSVDAPLVVHLEGYDVSVTARPGQPQTMEFAAFAAGRFPVHAHAADTVRQGQGHAHGRGVLLRLEVHPK